MPNSIIEATSAVDTTPTERSAHLSELFSSVQGEGPYCGCRQIFVRFYGCHLQCTYCDTPETVTARQPRRFRPRHFRIEHTPGERDFSTQDNPVSPSQLAAMIAKFETRLGPHHSVAFTGGEPLIHAPFLRQLLPRIRESGMTTYLETAGDLVKAVRRLLPWLDIVAMDIKLPSVAGNRPMWDEHAAFLRVCNESNAEVVVKTVVSATTDPSELDTVADIVSTVSPTIVVVLQPVTAGTPTERPPSVSRLMKWQQRLSTRLSDVRVVPQTHRMGGLL